MGLQCFLVGALLIVTVYGRSDPSSFGRMNDACQDSDIRCPMWAERNECNINPVYMRINCKWSCGECGVCVDNDAQNCPGWAASGECVKNPYFMKVHCQRSCAVCGYWKKRK